MTNLNAVIPILMHLFIFFLLKNVLFAQSNKCRELHKTKTSASEKRRYVMTSDFRQYNAEYTLADF